jgi:hypothetical protein
VSSDLPGCFRALLPFDKARIGPDIARRQNASALALEVRRRAIAWREDRRSQAAVEAVGGKRRNG